MGFLKTFIPTIKINEENEAVDYSCFYGINVFNMWTKGGTSKECYLGLMTISPYRKLVPTLLM